MRKMLSFLILSISTLAYSQNSYLNVLVGYGLGLPGEPVIQINPGGDFTTKYIGYGGGVLTGASFGFMLGKMTGIELGLNYQNNLGQDIKSWGTFLFFDPNFSISQATKIERYSSWSLSFVPSFKIQAASTKLKPFILIGPSLNYSGFSIKTDISGSGFSQVQEEEYQANLTIGAHSSVGVELPLTENLIFITSLQYALAFGSPASSEIIRFEENGESQLSQLTTSEKEVRYEKEGTLGNSNDLDNPVVLPRYRYDYSRIGVIIGVKIILD